MTEKIPIGETDAAVPSDYFSDRLAEHAAARARSDGDKLNSIDWVLKSILDAAVHLSSEQREQQLNKRLDLLKARLDSLVMPLWLVVILLAALVFR